MKNAQNMLDAGTPLNEIFDEVKPLDNGLIEVTLNDKKNIINDNKLILTRWVDAVDTPVDTFNNGFARVKLNGKWNYIDTKGNLLSDQWFDHTGEFSDGFATVVKDGVKYRLDTKGNLTPID